jgi:hypothetical protein
MAALRDSLGDTRLCRPEAGRIKEHDHRRPLSTPAWGVATSVVLGPSGVSIWINVVAMSTVSLFRPHPDTKFGFGKPPWRSSEGLRRRLRRRRRRSNRR